MLISPRHPEVKARLRSGFLFCCLPGSLGNCTLITSNGFAWTHSKLMGDANFKAQCTTDSADYAAELNYLLPPS